MEQRLINMSDIPKELYEMLQQKHFENMTQQELLDIQEWLLSYANVHYQRQTEHWYQIYGDMCMFSLPVIFIIGIIGNLLSLLVMINKRMGHKSTNTFLTALAFSDTMVLLFGLLPEWIGLTFEFDVKVQSKIFCKFFHYSLYSFSQISAWLIVTVTIERYILICKPLLALSVCTTSKTKRCIVLVAAFYLVMNTHISVTIDLKTDKDAVYICEGAAGYEMFTHRILPIIDACLYAVIPSIAVAITNSLIIQKLLTRNLRRNALPSTGLIGQKEAKLTKVLLTVSITFVITSIPMSVFVILTEHLTASEMPLSNSAWIARAVCKILMYLNHSINFVLYSITGSKFRNVLFEILCKRRTKPVAANSLLNTNSANAHDVTSF